MTKPSLCFLCPYFPLHTLIPLPFFVSQSSGVEFPMNRLGHICKSYHCGILALALFVRENSLFVALEIHKATQTNFIYVSTLQVHIFCMTETGGQITQLLLPIRPPFDLVNFFNVTKNYLRFENKFSF